MRHGDGRLWPALAVVALAAGCGGTDLKRIEVGGHVFLVPERHIETASLPFLPPAGSGSLMAWLDPEAPRPDQLLLLVELAAATCKPGAQLGEQMQLVCAVVRGERPVPGPPGRLIKALRHADDPTQFDYLGEDGRVVLMCHVNPEDGSGSCDMTDAWRDLVWSVGLSPAQVPHAAEIRAGIVRRLDAWSADG